MLHESNIRLAAFREVEQYQKTGLLDKNKKKGKLSPNDIEDYNKDRAKQENKIQDLREKIEKYKQKLDKLNN